MPNHARRSVLLTLSGAAVAGLGGPVAAAAPVPFSSGSERPTLAAPADATDCHHHIYDSRFPIAKQATLKPADATVADYRLLQQRLGTTRNVVVQPSTYGTDNRCMLDALGQFGSRSRGVAVVTTDVDDAELKALNAAGVRGIRFNLAQGGTTTIDMVDPLAGRVAGLGWHIQVNAPAETIVAARDLWRRLPCPVVFDHLAHVPEPGGIQDPTYALVSDLLQRGKAWVKLSGAYMNSLAGPPGYADKTAVAQGYVRAAPERLVWGSDWPHPTEKTDKPDDAILFDLLAVWAPDAATRSRILVANPAELYGFG
jgi:predicted TIM-barrel fold metal-dependent hydrolase